MEYAGQHMRFRYLLHVHKTHADASSWARGLNFGFCLPFLPYFVNVRSKGFGITMPMCRLVLNIRCLLM